MIFASLGALPELLVWDHQSRLHASEGRPRQEYAALCGQLRVDGYFCEPADPKAKGVVERLQDFIERSFEPGRASANELDVQLHSARGPHSAKREPLAAARVSGLLGLP